MNEMSMAEKEAVLRDNPELGFDELDGALSVKVIRNIRDWVPDSVFICVVAGEKPDTVGIRSMLFRNPVQVAEATVN